MPRVQRHAGRSFYIAYAAWLVGIFGYFVPAATWNPVSRFSTTRAIVEQQTLSIDAYAASTGDRALVGGRWYSDKTPIPSLLAVPTYAAAHAYDRLIGTSPKFTAIGTRELPARRLEVNKSFKRSLYLCTLSTAGAAGVAIGVMLFELLRRRTSALGALTAAAVTLLGTPLLPYATSLYGHIVAGAFLLGAVIAVDPRGPNPVPSARGLRVAGACLPLAVGSEYITAVPALAIGIWVLTLTPRRMLLRSLANLALGAVIPVAIVAIYHAICFGSPIRTGYSFIARPEFAAGHAKGFLGIELPRWEALVGLLFSRRRGLFYVSPVALVAVAGSAFYAWRNRDSAARIGIVVFALLLLVNAGYYMWWGGAATGPRHIVPVMAFLAFGLAAVWRVAWARFVMLALGAVSVANAIAITAVGLEAPEFDDVLVRYAWPRLFSGDVAKLSGASNLGIEVGLSARISLVLLALWIVFGFRHLVKLLREQPTMIATEPQR